MQSSVNVSLVCPFPHKHLNIHNAKRWAIHVCYFNKTLLKVFVLIYLFMHILMNKLFADSNDN